jgi:CO/xanthine dehydrogenase FAD-binding subunit
MLPEYDALMPGSLAEALQALAERGEGVLPIAGGTNVVVAMREGGHRGKTLMDVSRLPELRGIQVENGTVRVGGGTTVAELLGSPLIAQHARPLHQAARVFANPLIRNRATVAGNIVDASPAADTAPPLLVLEAEVELVSVSGRRRVRLDQFMLGVNQTVRRPEELVLAFRWTVPSAHSAGAHHKLALRRGTACSVISVAVMVVGDGTGRVTQARIALGAVASRPIRVPPAEEALVGARLTAETVERTAGLAAEAAQPIDDVRSTAAYRMRMVRVLVRRLLDQVAQELG